MHPPGRVRRGRRSSAERARDRPARDRADHGDAERHARPAGWWTATAAATPAWEPGVPETARVRDRRVDQSRAESEQEIGGEQVSGGGGRRQSCQHAPRRRSTRTRRSTSGNRRAARWLTILPDSGADTSTIARHRQQVQAGVAGARGGGRLGGRGCSGTGTRPARRRLQTAIVLAPKTARCGRSASRPAARGGGASYQHERHEATRARTRTTPGSPARSSRPGEPR